MEKTSKERTLCLETLREGAAVERFNDELKVVLRNMVDFNTDHNVKRSVTLTVEFLPNEERTGFAEQIKCVSKLAPPKPVKGFGYIKQETNGDITATEFNPQQPELPMIGRKASGQ